MALQPSPRFLQAPQKSRGEGWGGGGEVGFVEGSLIRWVEGLEFKGSSRVFKGSSRVE